MQFQAWRIGFNHHPPSHRNSFCGHTWPVALGSRWLEPQCPWIPAVQAGFLGARFRLDEVDLDSASPVFPVFGAVLILVLGKSGPVQKNNTDLFWHWVHKWSDKEVLDILGWHMLDSCISELREQNYEASQWALNLHPPPMEEKDGKQTRGME